MRNCVGGERVLTRRFQAEEKWSPDNKHYRESQIPLSQRYHPVHDRVGAVQISIWARLGLGVEVVLLDIAVTTKASDIADILSTEQIATNISTE
jgi:hypothetical protein